MTTEADGRRIASGEGERSEGAATADFDYDLPEGRIALRPSERRDASRLLVLHRDDGSIEDHRFSDILRFLVPGDALVLNDTQVFPARLLGRKPTGAAAEILLLRPLAVGDPAVAGAAGSGPWPAGAVWTALVRPGGKLKPGRVVDVADGFRVRVLDSTPDGGRIVLLEGDEDPFELVERHGTVPLPPYIDREPDEDDRERYQTVYARARGSVAAPTAGLHFTPELLRAVESAGIETVRVTLHVGPGTFRPVEAERPEEHPMHPERYEVSAAAAAALNRARKAGGRIWAVGTTSARTLETAVDAEGLFRARAGWTELFIRPPWRFRGVDVLLTNFHLPRSTLLMLVSALAGRDRVLAAYRHAVREGYRFYSYGDAMLVL
jgi:S-adenosylmethionine:tRNA ribosyltransferase-isomerase